MKKLALISLITLLAISFPLMAFIKNEHSQTVKIPKDDLIFLADDSSQENAKKVLREYLLDPLNKEYRVKQAMYSRARIQQEKTFVIVWDEMITNQKGDVKFTLVEKNKKWETVQETTGTLSLSLQDIALDNNGGFIAAQDWIKNKLAES